MDEESQSTIISSFEKNSRETVCVGTALWHDHKLIFVRLYVPASEGEGLVPTREGATLPIEKYAELLDGLRTLKDATEKECVTAKIQKNKTHQVWVGANEYKGMALRFIRTYAPIGEAGELKPTKQGVSIKAELYPQLLDAVEKLGKAIQPPA
jgi:hypothetical protein